jgi:hypothetical protein
MTEEGRQIRTWSSLSHSDGPAEIGYWDNMNGNNRAVENGHCRYKVKRFLWRGTASGTVDNPRRTPNNLAKL